MISRNLISAFNSAWLIEPSAAEKWAHIALDLLHPSAAVNPISKFDNVESQPFQKNGVFILPVNGPLMKNESCGAPGTANMIESLKLALADTNVEAIVLQIDSPGGTVDGTKVFADTVKASTKPVVAFVDGLMASAAMWIGSSASAIVASTPTDMVGSIGTMMQWADFTEAYKQRGIKVHTATATDSVDKNRLIADATSTGNYTQLVNQLLDPVNEQFTNAIKKNRAGKLNLQQENVLTGKVYMAKDAMKYGLVDKIGTLDSAIKLAKQMAADKNKQKMESTAAFQNVLTAAQAESFELVDNIGFGLTETHMNNIDAKLAEQQAEIERLTQAATGHEAALNAANEAKAAAEGQVQTLQAKITEMGSRAAAATPVPVTAADPENIESDKFLTSADIEKRKLQEKYGN